MKLFSTIYIFLFVFAFLILPASCISMDNISATHNNPDSSNESFFVPNDERLPAHIFLPAGKKPFLVNIVKDKKIQNTLNKSAVNSTFSVSFKSAKLSTVFEMLSDEGRYFSYILTPEVANRTVTALVLKDITWSDALAVIAKTNNLKIKTENSLYIISTNKEYEANLRGEMELVKLEKERAGLKEAILVSNMKSSMLENEKQKTFRSFRLKYTQPDAVIVYLEKIFANNSTDSFDKSSNKKSNLILSGDSVVFSIFPNSSILTAYGSPSSLSDVEKRLEDIDIPQKQVYIESRIVEIRRNYTRSLGIEWGGYDIPASDLNIQLSGGTPHNPGTSLPGSPSAMPQSVVSFPATLPNTIQPVPGGIGVLIGNATGTSRLFGRLSALEQDGKSKTLSNPKITTINGVKARIQSGQQIPYQAQADISTGSISTTVKFQDAVISLEVTPYITTDNRINMKISAKKDNPDFTNQVLNVPTISTRKIDTNVLVNNGGTAILGGVFENLESNSEQGIPFFSKIPILGWLFKGNASYDDEKELLIFITPHIIGDDIS